MYSLRVKCADGVMSVVGATELVLFEIAIVAFVGIAIPQLARQWMTIEKVAQLVEQNFSATTKNQLMYFD